MIRSKTDYQFYLESDRISNGISERSGLMSAVRNYFFPNYIWLFIASLRKVEYYANTPSNPIKQFKKFFALLRFRRLSIKLGFSIPVNSFGPGLSIAHYGTIIVNQSAKIGANCRIHAGVNIGSEAGYSDKAPTIGDNCYIGPGAKIFGNIHIARGTAIGANAVVNRSVDEENLAIGGVPAKKIGETNTLKMIIPGSMLASKGISANELAGMAAHDVLAYMQENDPL